MARWINELAWSSQRTRPVRPLAAACKAAVNRAVIGTCLARPPFGTVTRPLHSDRATQSCRASTTMLTAASESRS